MEEVVKDKVSDEQFVSDSNGKPSLAIAELVSKAATE